MMRGLWQHWRWLLARRIYGPARRRGWCLDCGAEIEQVERSPGIWRELFCPACLAREAPAAHPHKEAA